MEIEFCNPGKLTDEQLFELESRFGKSLPLHIREFLKHHSGSQPRIKDKLCLIKITHGDGWEQDNFIERIPSFENLQINLSCIDYLKEDVDHFNLDELYVETEYLFPFAHLPNGAVYVAVGGRHVDKVFTADSGDFGILFHSNTFQEFWDSAYHDVRF